MSDTLKNLVWRMPHKGHMVPCEEEMPVCGVGQVLVRMEYCGICGSDMHFFERGAIGTRQAPKDFILGHESAGTVIAAGEGVKNLRVGDRVALEPGVPCGTCEFCMKGLYNLCPEVHFMAAARPATDGALRQYMAYPEKWCFKLPPSVSTLQACMVEPLAVGLHAAVRGGAGFGKSALIIGVGPIGYMTLLACRAMGASRIIVSDMLENRLQKAAESGADMVIDAAKQDAVQAVLDATDGYGCDIVFECTGSARSFADTWKYVRPGGVIVNVANAGGDIPYRFDELERKEADIRHVWRYRHLYPAAIDALATGRISLDRIEPTIFPYAQSEQAFEYAIREKSSQLKVIIQIAQPEEP